MPTDLFSYGHSIPKNYRKEWESFYYAKGCSYLKVLSIIHKKDMSKKPPRNIK